MIIHILQKAVSVENKFQISIDNKRDYSCEGYSYLLDSRYTISNKKLGQIMSIFRTYFGLFNCFNIYFNNEQISERKKPLKFRTKNYFRNHFYCKWDKDMFEIYAHKGLKYSIFKNGKQIAGISQDRWTSFKEDGFRLECNNDAEKELLIAFTIILDHLFNRNVEFLYGLFSLNFGVLLEAKIFNEEWKA